MPAPGDFGVDVRASCFGVFLGLKDEHRSTFAEHEAVTVGVVGA